MIEDYFIKQAYYLTLPLIVILILSPLCFYGFDFTDLGYHITNQLQANSIGLRHFAFNPYWAGSDIAGGLWIKLFGDNLWVIRSFTVLIYASCFLLILIETKPANYLAVLVMSLLSSSPMPSGMILLADYYTLPMLAITCWSVIWSKLNQTNHLQNVLLIFLAIASFAATFFRLPLLILFLIPPFMFLINKKHMMILLWVFLCLIGVILLYTSDILKYLLEGLIQQKAMLEKVSGLETFLPPFIAHMKENSFFALQLTIITYLISKSFKKSYLNSVCFIYIIVFLLAIFDTFALFDTLPILRGIANSCSKRGLNSLHLIMSFAIFMGLIRDRTRLYLAPIAVMPFILNFGTNTGISKMNYLLPVTFFCLIQLYVVRINKKLICILLLISIPWNYKNFYRDGHFFELKSLPDGVSKLNHLQTSEKTADKILWIETLVNDYQLRHRMILNYPVMASIYYLSNSPLYMGYPWSHFIKKDRMFSEIKKDCNSGQLKAVFIDTAFEDSTSLINFISTNCTIKSRKEFNSILFLSI